MVIFFAFALNSSSSNSLITIESLDFFLQKADFHEKIVNKLLNFRKKQE